MGIEPSKVLSIRNGCERNIFRPADRHAARDGLGISHPSRLILFVGRLEVEKGVGELFSAFCVLMTSHPELVLAYVGDGPQATTLKANIKTQGLQDRILMAGACTSSGVALWLAASDLLVLPSYGEGCPNAVLEALNCGRPVVATAVGDIRELLSGETGIVVAPREVASLANAIERALNREWSASSISESFKRGWDEAANELLAVCESVMEQRVHHLRLP